MLSAANAILRYDSYFDFIFIYLPIIFLYSSDTINHISRFRKHVFNLLKTGKIFYNHNDPMM